jgi:alpha-tubulin suppressor-like RCC1 family protein
MTARILSALVAMPLAMPLACSARGEVLREGSSDPIVLQPTDVRLATGYFHACAVVNSKLYCWGQSSDGELGLPLGEDIGPRVISVSSPRAPAAGRAHSCVLDNTGRVYCFGDNQFGQLGSGDPEPQNATPSLVTLPAPAVALASSFDHNCALLSDASLWCWGANREGQLGLGDTHPGADHFEPVRVGTQHDWTFVSTGQGHSCGIRAPGSLYCWGRNTGFQIGQGSSEPQQYRSPQRVGADTDWVEVSAGQNDTCARKRSGTIYCWGNPEGGALAVGDASPRSTPTLVPEIDDWLSVSTNTFHTCGVRKNGQIWCAGRNTEGELGASNLVDVVPNIQPVGSDTDWTEVRAGRFFTCARKADDSVFCTGANEAGQVSSDPSVDRSNTMLRVAL